MVSCNKNQKHVEWQKVLNYKSHEIFPIKIKYGFPYVDVLVNNKKVSLLFDLGNMSKLVLDESIIDTLALPLSGKSKSYTSSGELLEIRNTYTISDLTFLGLKFHKQTAHEFTNSHFGGLLGPGFIYNKRFTLDYKNECIAVSETPLPLAFPENQILRMIQSPRKNLKPLVLVKGSVNSHEVVMEIDTGKSRTCVDVELVKQMKLTKVERDYLIHDIKFGSYSFSVPSAKESNFKGISKDLQEPILLSIGSDILAELVLSVDYAQQILMVCKNF